MSISRIVDELKSAVAWGNDGVSLQLTAEEAKSLLMVLEYTEIVERAAYNSRWAESNRIDAERNRGYEQGEG